MPTFLSAKVPVALRRLITSPEKTPLFTDAAAVLKKAVVVPSYTLSRATRLTTVNGALVITPILPESDVVLRV